MARPKQSEQSWFEVACVMKVQAVDENSAVNLAAAAIKTGYSTVKGSVFPMGTFDVRPCESPLTRAR